jgi:hypothetical protein
VTLRQLSTKRTKRFLKGKQAFDSKIRHYRLEAKELLNRLIGQYSKVVLGLFKTNFQLFIVNPKPT